MKKQQISKLLADVLEYAYKKGFQDAKTFAKQFGAYDMDDVNIDDCIKETKKQWILKD